jgi:hypothetical protein
MAKDKDTKEPQGDLELPEEVADDVTGGGAAMGEKTPSYIYSKSVKSDKVEFTGAIRPIDRTSSTQPFGSLGGSDS